MNPSGPASRNGMRQPQLRSDPSSSDDVIRKPVSAPATDARPTVSATTLAYRARRPSGAYSMMNAEAPVYSPPVEKPCMARSRNSRIGAAMPSVA